MKCLSAGVNASAQCESQVGTLPIRPAEASLRNVSTEHALFLQDARPHRQPLDPANTRRPDGLAFDASSKQPQLFAPRPGDSRSEQLKVCGPGSMGWTGL